MSWVKRSRVRLWRGPADPPPIPLEETAPLEQHAFGVLGLRIRFVNVFAVADGAGWTLVDAGLPGSAEVIHRWAADSVSDSPPRAIVLTHGHFDHVGALEALMALWRVPIYAHAGEIPFVTGERSYDAANAAAGGRVMTRAALQYPWRQAGLDERLRELPADGSLPVLRGWRWLHTPGHSPGHVSLFRDADRALIGGDAFCTTPVESFWCAAQPIELHGPPPDITADWDAARASVRRLAELQPASLAAGHGPTIGDGSARLVAELAERFAGPAAAAPDAAVAQPAASDHS